MVVESLIIGVGHWAIGHQVIGNPQKMTTDSMTLALFAPIQNEKKAEQRTAQVGEVGDVVPGKLVDTQEQLYQHQHRDKIFGFDGDWQENQHEFGIREIHAERQQ